MFVIKFKTTDTVNVLEKKINGSCKKIGGRQL